MATGMSGVFGFLLLLVGLMHVSGRAFRTLDRWFPEPVPVKGGPGSAPPTSAQIAEEEAIAVALAIAAARRGAKN